MYAEKGLRGATALAPGVSGSLHLTCNQVKSAAFEDES